MRLMAGRGMCLSTFLFNLLRFCSISNVVLPYRFLESLHKVLMFILFAPRSCTRFERE